MKNKKRILLLAILFTFHIGHAYAETKRISARTGHSAIYDSANKQMIIFGGNNQRVALSDLWVYDIEKNTWKEIETDKSPPARTRHSAIYDSTKKQMLIFGGYGQKGFLSDLWVYDIEKKIWRKIETEESPPAGDYSGVYDSINKQMVVFGGVGHVGVFSDLWRYNIDKKVWERIEIDEVPPARQRHAAIYDSANKQILIWGGFSAQSQPLSDLWVYDIEKKTWEEIKTDKMPAGRQHHSAIYDSVHKQMLIFGGSGLGGSGQGGPFFDLWVYNIEKKTWEKITTKKASLARHYHSAIYDSANKQMLIFGGSGQDGFLSDLWAFDIENKTWEKLKPAYEKD